MLITFPNGAQLEGVLLSQSQTHLRVAIRSWDDVAEFTRYRDVWISEQCEPVRIEMEWERMRWPEDVAEADCICSQELASHLIHGLFSGEDEQHSDPMRCSELLSAPMLSRHVI